MLRLIISIVFCFSIVAGSHAHAAMLAAMQPHEMTVEQTQADDTCWEKPAERIAVLGKHCMRAFNSKSTGQRCQVDVAPLVSEPELPKAGKWRDRLLTGWQICTGIDQMPALGPPRKV